jgi:hypothetical protein
MPSSSPTDAFTSMLHAFDAKNWPAVREAFADEVDVDYSALSGAPAARTTADQLVAGWERAAGAFDATQHLTGPFVVSPRGDGLHVRTHVRAYHRTKGDAGGIWLVAGHYEVQLNPAGDLWKVAAITLHVLYQERHADVPAT